jgi:hypothetical protein
VWLSRLQNQRLIESQNCPQRISVNSQSRHLAKRRKSQLLNPPLENVIEGLRQKWQQLVGWLLRSLRNLKVVAIEELRQKWKLFEQVSLKHLWMLLRQKDIDELRLKWRLSGRQASNFSFLTD